MQVDEAQSMVPGITFREFWQSRMEQWKYWDDELRDAGSNSACANTGNIMFAYRLITAAPATRQYAASEFDQLASLHKAARELLAGLPR